LMTTYERENHIRLFRQGEEDARVTLTDLWGAEQPQAQRD